MSALYVDDAQVAVRRVLATGPDAPFAPLVSSLAADLVPVMARAVWLPPNKARLTRIGGTCPRDGARLAFDPFTPQAHRCPACGAVYDRIEDYEWWTMGYQLWLAERTVHAAALALVVGNSGAGPSGATGDFGAFAARVLDVQAGAYLQYPNGDNVLGPARPFFSTYLESLWLVHVCTALDLLRAAAPGAYDALASRVLDRVVEPSRALVAGFPEGTSNRQVWHAVARLGAARVLGDADGARDAVHGPNGLARLLRTALLEDGSWYEGENYHQFAHRGFWYGLRMAECAGIDIAPDLVARFRAGYAVPFRVALPDGTLPARRDAQYAVSLRQWRWAEWCELGVRDDAGPKVRASLADLYATADPPLAHRSGRWRATGESERNEPASALSRADLGWKSLLFARGKLLSPAADAGPRSELLADQGVAVIRRDAGRIYAALDYGGGGGGHGHPDLLNVILQDGAVRWLDDPGTGTYVERTLHWYRSTLAHAAPLADGQSQLRGIGGVLVGFDPGRGDAGPSRGAHNAGGMFAGVAARAAIQPTLASRALVVGNAYVVDLFTWRAWRPCVVDLPFLVDGVLPGEPEQWVPFEPGGRGGIEDGFDFVHAARAVVLGPSAVPFALAAHGSRSPAGARLWLCAPGATFWRGVAPGPPGTGERRFHAVRMHGGSAAVVAVWDLRGAIEAVRTDADAIVVEHVDGIIDRHTAPAQLQLERNYVPNGGPVAPPRDDPPDQADWRIVRRAPGGGYTEQRLALVVPPHSDRPPSRFSASPAGRDAPDRRRPVFHRLVTHAPSLTFDLGEPHYLRSEPSWREAGAPNATVRVSLDDAVLAIDVDVRLGRPPAFAPLGASNPLDNERADVNSDGLQLLVAPTAAAEFAASWLLVPEQPAPLVRVARVEARGVDIDVEAAWRAAADGWRIRCRVARAALAGEFVAFDVAVNEKPSDRERRRGQLRLGEAGSPFVYLRGDRMDVAGAVWLQLAPADPAP